MFSAMDSWELYLSPQSPLRVMLDERDRASTHRADERTSRVTRAISDSDAVTDHYGAATLRVLESQQDSIRQMVDTLKHPLSTAAKERLERGIFAARNGWDDDAREELEASISADRFSPLAHLYLGMVHQRLGAPDDAVTEYGLALKYGTGDAALSGRAWLLLVATDAEQALAMIPPQLNTCAEVAFQKAIATGSREDLRRAFELAPELIADGHLIELPDVDAVVAGLLEDSSSYVGRIDQLCVLLNHPDVRVNPRIAPIAEQWDSAHPSARIVLANRDLSRINSALDGIRTDRWVAAQRQRELASAEESVASWQSALQFTEARVGAATSYVRNLARALFSLESVGIDPFNIEPSAFQIAEKELGEADPLEVIDRAYVDANIAHYERDWVGFVNSSFLRRGSGYRVRPSSLVRERVRTSALCQEITPLLQPPSGDLLRANERWPTFTNYADHGPASRLLGFAVNIHISLQHMYMTKGTVTLSQLHKEHEDAGRGYATAAARLQHLSEETGPDAAPATVVDDAQNIVGRLLSERASVTWALRTAVL